MLIRISLFIYMGSFISAEHLLLKSAVTIAGRNGPQYPPFKGCGKRTPVPEASDVIPTYRIDLDLPPQQRWNQLVHDKKDKIQALLVSIKNNTDKLFGTKLFYLVDNYMPYLTRTLPEPYYEELVGISHNTNISLGEVTLFNVFYEFFSVCTSIIMEGRDGKMYHGRNLDFGLFLGWDVATNTWLTTEYLKPLVVKLDFCRKNKTIFQSINFAGYIGVLTAVKQNAFSLTVNERFKLNGGYIGISEWILGFRHQKWMGLLTREVMETADSYSRAQKMLAKSALVAPVYFILAGNESSQGCVITRSRNKFDVLSIKQMPPYQNSSWYLLETNYDHWENPPFYDDRRSPSVQCMEEFGQEKPFSTLYSVLSTRPVLNKLTTYTSLIDVRNGSIEAWLRYCDNPCWPW